MNKADQEQLNALIPAPVNIKMRWDFWMRSIASAIVLCCDNLSRCRSLADMIRKVVQEPR